MSEITIKLPDIGEGIAESEISEWLVSVGDWINEDDPLVVVLTDKAAVEIPSSVSGKVSWLGGEAGEILSVGAPLVKIDALEGGEEKAKEPVLEKAMEPAADTRAPVASSDPVAEVQEVPPLTKSSGKALAAPAVRKRAIELGVSLSSLSGTGPEGRVTHGDLDRLLSAGAPVTVSGTQDEVTEVKVIGLRRKIAEQMSRSHAHVPAITIVEEVDVTDLERLRNRMNADRSEGQPKLTLLPFLIRAMDIARDAAPQVNARYDDEAGVLHQHSAAHIGIATQTDNGLMVPVMTNAGGRSLWNMASEIRRLADGAREGGLTREELSGSTMTITSLGPLGAVATTPIVNHPEVAILGVNRKQIRPVWDGSQFVPREVMNLSASFDHRIVDGWDAAQFIARLKDLLETPALLFAKGGDRP